VVNISRFYTDVLYERCLIGWGNSNMLFGVSGIVLFRLSVQMSKLSSTQLVFTFL